MLLEPQCTTSITSSWHPLCLKLKFWSFLTKTKPDQAFPSDAHGQIWPHSTHLWVMIFFISPFFRGTLSIIPITSFSTAFSPITDLYQTVHVPTRLIIGAQKEAEQFLQISSTNSSLKMFLLFLSDCQGTSNKAICWVCWTQARTHSLLNFFSLSSVLLLSSWDHQLISINKNGSPKTRQR